MPKNKIQSLKSSLKYSMILQLSPQSPVLTYDYSKADWVSFGNTITASLQPFVNQYSRATEISNAEIDHLIEEMTRSIIDAQEATVPKRTSKGEFTVTPSLQSAKSWYEEDNIISGQGRRFGR